MVAGSGLGIYMLRIYIVWRLRNPVVKDRANKYDIISYLTITIVNIIV